MSRARHNPDHRAADLRVVVVGRTGAEQRLRRDPTVELVRARTALDAVGEVACPIDDDSPRRCVALIAPDVAPNGDASDFIGALRRLDANIRVVAVQAGPRAAVATNATPYDAVVPESVSADDLRDVFLRAANNSAQRAEHTPHVTELADAYEPTPQHEHDPLLMVRAMLTGADPMPALLAEVRRRLNDPDAEFLTAASPDDHPSFETPVAWRGRTLGRLRSRAAPPELLAAAADWLAHWLALREQHAQMRSAAFTDPVTGVWNRRYFDYFLPRAIDVARRRRLELSLLLFDIDDFKKFNDEHGHDAGDTILRETVRLLRASVRPSDRVCRVGGDEFAVIFFEPDGPRDPASRHPASPESIVNRFQMAVCGQCFPKLGKHAPGSLTISGGMATFPWHAEDAQSLVLKADALISESKRLGKNRITFGPQATGPEDAC